MYISVLFWLLKLMCRHNEPVLKVLGSRDRMKYIGFSLLVVLKKPLYYRTDFKILAGYIQ